MSTISAFVGQKYAFASGRTSVLRQSLVTQSDVDRMLGSHDLHSMEQILTELKFTNAIDQGITGSERILAALEQWVMQEVQNMVQGDKWFIFNILWVNGDAPLLAWALKRKLGLTNVESKEPMSGLHAFAKEDLLSLAETSVSDTLPKEFTSLATAVSALEEPTSIVLDTIAEKAVAAYRLGVAKKSGSSDIVRFVRTSIDLGNIRTALRLRKDDANALDSLIPGGFIAVRSLIGGKDGVKRGLAASDLSLKLGGDISEILGDPLRFERKAAELLADNIGRMWNVPLTVEPVFAFAAIALSHIALIRAIAIGKRSALSPQDIKLILPPFIPSSRFSS